MTASGERAPLTERDRIEPPELLPEMRVEAQRPARIAVGVDRLSHGAARDKVENEEVVAGLRRGEAEAGDDGLERGPDAMLPRVRPRRRRIALVLRREEGRIDHHHRGELVAEIMGKPSCDAPAERMADDNRRPGVERAGLAPRLPRLADELAEIVSVAANPNAPCR